MDKPLVIGSSACILAGVATFFVKHIGPEPQVSCVAEGKPTSGFSITKDGKDCALSVEDFRKLWAWEHDSALTLHRIGLALVLLGIIGLVFALVRRARRRKQQRPDAPGHIMSGPATSPVTHPVATTSGVGHQSAAQMSTNAPGAPTTHHAAESGNAVTPPRS